MNLYTLPHMGTNIATNGDKEVLFNSFTRLFDIGDGGASGPKLKRHLSIATNNVTKKNNWIKYEMRWDDIRWIE